MLVSAEARNSPDGRSDVPPILSSTSVESPIIRKGRSDVKKRFTEAQIIGFLRETEAGLPVKDLCRRHGFSEASYYLWRSKFGGMRALVHSATRQGWSKGSDDAVTS